MHIVQEVNTSQQNKVPLNHANACSFLKQDRPVDIHGQTLSHNTEKRRCISKAPTTLPQHSHYALWQKQQTMKLGAQIPWQRPETLQACQKASQILNKEGNNFLIYTYRTS